MERYWCIDCRTEVELDKHARCGTCNSEAVDSLERKGMRPVVPAGLYDGGCAVFRA